MKLKINHKKKTKKYTKTWKLNNMLLNNEWVNNKIKEKINRYLERNENMDTTVRSLGETGKAILRGKFIILLEDLKKQETVTMGYKVPMD